METTAAHKPHEFQEYRLRESPLRGKRVTKISNLGGSGHYPQIWPDLGQIWLDVVN